MQSCCFVGSEAIFFMDGHYFSAAPGWRCSFLAFVVQHCDGVEKVMIPMLLRFLRNGKFFLFLFFRLDLLLLFVRRSLSVVFI